ncbi:unnamed protein product [Brassica oleracea]
MGFRLNLPSRILLLHLTLLSGRNRFERGYGSGGFKTMMVRRLWLVLMLSVDVFN